MTKWIYQGKELTEAPVGMFGFLYQITYENGMKYVGRCYFGKQWKWYQGGGTRIPDELKDTADYQVLALFATRDELFNAEATLIDDLDAVASEEFYNVAQGGGSVGALGYRHTDEARKKMSETNKGKKLTDETKKKISEGNKGKIRTAETKKKISEAKKGKTSNRKGVKLTDETRKRLSEARKKWWAERKKESANAKN